VSLVEIAQKTTKLFMKSNLHPIVPMVKFLW